MTTQEGPRQVGRHMGLCIASCNETRGPPMGVGASHKRDVQGPQVKHMDPIHMKIEHLQALARSSGLSTGAACHDDVHHI